MKTQIHELRTRIDGLAQLVGLLNTPITERSSGIQLVTMTYEIRDCHKSLLLAKAWLGKVLAELGEETPYKNDGNRKTVEDIEPTADRNIPINNGADLIKGKIGTCEEGNAGYSFGKLEDCRNENFEYFSDKTYIEKIDWLREEIKTIGISTSNTELDLYRFKITVSSQNSIKQALNHLTEARFHLGFELQRIKEQ